MNTTKKATKSQTKEHNKRLVLQTLYEREEISRAGLARMTRLTRPTISSIVSELLEEGLVAEVGQTPSQGGKPATLLSVVADARYLIGVDLANSEFRGAVVNLRGEIVQRSSKLIEDRDGERALALVYELLDELVASVGSPLLGIGIGTPGIIDAEQGIVRTAVNLDWQDLPLTALLHERYGCPAYVANDSQVAALAQYTFGQNEHTRNLIVLKVGRGVGAGIVLNGQLYFGDGSGAGEVGHFVVVDDGERCRCGHFGCLETVAGSRAIVRQATRQNPEYSTTAAVMLANAAGDEAVRAIVAEAGRYLGIAAAALVSALNIHAIVVAGTLAPLGETLLMPMRQEMHRRAMNQLAIQTAIRASELGDDIVILGAAALLLSEELGLSG